MTTTPRILLCALSAAIALAYSSSAFAGQPHMEAAIKNLEEAKAHLQQAEANKGGWRVSAMKTIDSVIEQIRNGEEHAKDSKKDNKKKNK